MISFPLTSWGLWVENQKEIIENAKDALENSTNLKSQIETYEKNVSQLQNQISDILRENCEYKADIASCNIAALSYQDKIKDLQEQLNNKAKISSEKIVALEKFISSLHDELQNAVQLSKNLDDENRDYKKQLEYISQSEQRVVTKLKDELQLKEKLIIEYSRSIDAIKVDDELSRKERLQLEERNAMLLENVEDVKRTNQDLKYQLEQARSIYDTCQKNVIALQRDHDELIKELEKKELLLVRMNDRNYQVVCRISASLSDESTEVDRNEWIKVTANIVQVNRQQFKFDKIYGPEISHFQLFQQVRNKTLIRWSLVHVVLL